MNTFMYERRGRETCRRKVAMSEHATHMLCQRLRDDEGLSLEAYRCLWCASWHAGHPLTMSEIVVRAVYLRARSGNAPTEPGTGTTRRRRRRHV